MANEFEQLANDLKGKKDIQRLVNSADGQKVKSIVGKNAASLKDAVKKGDTATLQNALQSIMETDEGARLVQQLGDLLNH